VSWLSAPTQSDEEANRIARVVHVVGIGIILAVLPPMVTNLTVGRWPSAVALLAEQLLAATCLVLNRRGAVHIASRLLALSAIGLATGLQLTGQHGVHDVTILIYPGAIIVAGALFERRWFVLFTVLTMAAFALQYALELGGIVSNQLSDHAELRLLIDAEVILGISALGVGLMMGSLRKSMAQAQAAASSLRESEKLYRSLFEAVTEAIIVFDPKQNRIADANPRVAEWFGYTLEELRSLTAGDLSSNLLGFTEEKAMGRIRLAAEGSPQLFEWQARARDGRRFWVEVSTRTALVGGQPRLLISLRDM
jgi:PAS domain S-box-containing protein